MPDRVLRVTGLVLEDDLAGTALTRVEYTITPALPPHGRRGGVAGCPVVWTWAATDDAGTDYQEAGGGYGPRGDHTEGVLSLTPVPPPDARRLRVVLRPWFPWADPAERFRECAVDVDLAAAPRTA